MGTISARAAVDRKLARFLRTHHGAIGADELARLGVTKNAKARLVTGEVLLRQHRGVYRSGHTVVGPMTLRRCGLIAVGEDAALGRATAAHHLGHIDFAPPVIDIVVPRTSVGRTHRGLRVYRAAELTPVDVRRVNGLRCTTPERTILDLAAVTRTGPQFKLLRRAVRQATVKNKRLPERWMSTIEARGSFRGSRILATVLDEHLETTSLTRSELEDAFLDLCRTAGIPLPETNAMVEGFEVDGAWRLPRVVVELDTYDYHGDVLSFEKDRARDAVLTVAGYRTIRITGRRLEREPDEVVRQLRALLGLRPPRTTRTPAK